MAKPNKTALVSAVDLLAIRAHSVKMIVDKLLRKGYTDEEVNSAVEVLLARGYLNDEDLCKRVYCQYIDERKYSLKQIQYKLLQKGFTSQMIEQSKTNMDDDAEKAAAYRLLKAKYKVATKIDNIKMMQYLYGRGFKRESIVDAMQKFAEIDCQEFIEEV